MILNALISFSKDQIRTLYMLHENFARLLNTYLSAHLRTIVQVNVALGGSAHFMKNLSDPCLTQVVIGCFLKWRPLSGNALMEINPAVVFSIIDRLFGGVGTPPAKPRELYRH